MKERVESAKGLLDLLKQALIAAVIIYLLFSPATLGAWIKKTGLTKASFFGIEWEQNLTTTDEALQQAEADKTKLAAQLQNADASIKNLKETIAALQRPTAAPAPESVARIVDDAERVVDQNRGTIEVAQQNSAQSRQAIAANSALVQATSTWLLLTGSDRTEVAARDEVRKARAAGFQDVRIYRNRGVLRTAVVFADRQAAAAALPVAISKLRADAYIVGLDKWCANPRAVGNDVVECG